MGYAKAILPLIGHITEFEVFREKNDTRNEVWLDTLCGYGGTGPMATQEILQLFGLHRDYGITKNNHVHADGLQPSFYLNLLLYKEILITERAPLFWVSCDFSHAYQLFNARQCFDTIGHVMGGLLNQQYIRAEGGLTKVGT
ncbi:MAG: hypothetical protein M1318_08780 [Firmicutes bacterium]|nr:hypothetical protein [Bacillota bacterium]